MGVEVLYKIQTLIQMLVIYLIKLQYPPAFGHWTVCLDIEVNVTWSVLSKTLKKNQRDTQANQQLRDLLRSVVREVYIVYALDGEKCLHVA